MSIGKHAGRSYLKRWRQPDKGRGAPGAYCSSGAPALPAFCLLIAYSLRIQNNQGSGPQTQIKMQGNFLYTVLFPALFERIDSALPEFDFQIKETGSGRLWVAQSKLRPDGHTGSESRKTYISERNPSYINDLTGRGRSIWQYIQENKGLDNAATFAALCDLAGVKRNISPEEAERRAAEQKRAAIFEAANYWLLQQMHSHKSEAAEAARTYIKSRGYTLRDLRQPEEELKDSYTGGNRAEIGYLPNLPDFKKHLQGAGFSPEEIEKVLPEDSRAAGRVTLALREYGRILAFKFRSIDGKEPKYLNISGYEKSKHLPGLTKKEKLVFVEGEFDQFTAHAKGFLQVVATGGASLAEEQINAAIQAGAKSFTLAFDNDEAGKKGTRKAVEALLKRDGDFNIYVLQYPPGIKDLDELLRKPDGKEAAESALKNKIGYAQYLVNWLDQTRAEQIAQEAGGYQTAEFRDAITNEAVLIERLARPVDVPLIRQILGRPGGIYETYGIDQKALAEAEDSVREMEAARKYRAEIARIAQEAAQAAQAGKQEEAEHLLWVEAKEARRKLHAGRFAKLLEGHSRETIAAGLNPPGLKTSYAMQKKGLGDIVLQLPTGGISVVAAASGHGKTAFLINLLLDICKLNPDKKFHFFVLEESAAEITGKMLNTYLDMDFSDRNEDAIKEHLKGNSRFIKNYYLSEVKEKEPGFWQIYGNQIFIHYLDRGTAEELCEMIQYLNRKQEVGAVFVDYIQLLRLANPGRIDRTEELKQVCLLLRDTAVGTGLPLVFAAQFNRTVKAEEDTHHYTNIGEAGDIERIAALIVGLWNRTYTKETKEGGGPSDYIAARILKWRGGPAGYSAVWAWNGNRKRVYPGEATAAGGGTEAPAGNNFKMVKD